MKPCVEKSTWSPYGNNSYPGGCKPCSTCSGSAILADCTRSSDIVCASPSPSPKPVPKDVYLLVPYYVTAKGRECDSEKAIKTVLNPESEVATTVRAGFATTLGYEPNRALVTGVIACDNRFTAVPPSHPINVANATLKVKFGDDRFDDRRRRLQASPDPEIFSYLNSLNLTLDGHTVVIELGLAVPSMIGPALSRFISLVMGNAATTEIAAAAAAVDAVLKSPAYIATYVNNTAPNPLSPFLVNFAETASSLTSPNATNFSKSLRKVVKPALSLLSPVFNSTNISDFSTDVLLQYVRISTEYLPTERTPPALPGLDPPTKVLGLLGLLALIPLCIICACLMRCARRRKQKSEEPDDGSTHHHIPQHSADSSESSPSVCCMCVCGPRKDAVTQLDLRVTNPAADGPRLRHPEMVAVHAGHHAAGHHAAAHHDSRPDEEQQAELPGMSNDGVESRINPHHVRHHESEDAEGLNIRHLHATHDDEMPNLEFEFDDEEGGESNN